MKETELISSLLPSHPLQHLIPNAINPAIVLAARDVGGMVILQATFTFIGLTEGSP